MKYGLIRAYSGRAGVRRLCGWLSVSPSGYYAWLGRGPSGRERANAELSVRIAAIFEASRARYGSHRVHAQLRSEGRVCSLNRCAKLMRRRGLKAVRRRQHKVTTDSRATWVVEPNLLARRFSPGQVPAWVADFTAIRTSGGWLYLAVVLDLATRRVVGWSMDSVDSGKLILDALDMALEREQPPPGLLHHSDRGGHYAAYAYKAKLEAWKLLPSMSRSGDCWDNAVVESFFASLKLELLYPHPETSRVRTRARVFEYIEVFYNRQRRHSSLGYLSPDQYAKLVNAP